MPKGVRSLGILILAAQLCPALTIYSTDFEDGSPGWTGGVRQSASGAPVGIGLSNWLYRSDDTSPRLALNLGSLPAHSNLELEFTFVAIDSWDGTTTSCCTDDWLTARVNGAVVWNQAYRNFGSLPPSGAGSLLSAGIGAAAPSDWFYNGSHTDSAWLITVTVPHDASEALIEWSVNGGGWQGGDDESLALDNVRIRIDAVIPEPATVFLLGGALVGLGLIKRFRRA